MEKIDFPRFDFDSDLTRAVIELERSRADLHSGTTPPELFVQLTELFQLLTSIMSARIEGNRTSILDAVSGAAALRSSARVELDDGVEEILNIQRAVEFIEEYAGSTPIDHLFIRELHRIAVSGLRREGDPTPGAYRSGEVSIVGSAHQPPWPADVPDRMSALIAFIRDDVEPQMQLLQAAIAHHRFLWIHPFGNGNGRTARLLTYAMLVRQGYVSGADYRAVNPTAVFGSDRQGYYDNLEAADSLSNDGLVAWCTYVLSGLNTDIRKLGRLKDGIFVTEELIVPAVGRLRASGVVTASEAAALVITARRAVVKAGDLEPAFPGSPSTRSQAIRRLVDRGLLKSTSPGGRFYQLVLAPNALTVHIVTRLDLAGLLPRILSDDPV